MGLFDFLRNRDLNQTQERMRALDAQALLRLVAVDARQYREDALEIARNELRRRHLPILTEKEFWIKEWLKTEITVEQAEAKHMVSIPQLGPGAVPFGFLNSEWQRLLANIQEGDQLWEYCSPPESWEHLCGRKGIALIRNGRVIVSIQTSMN